MKQCAVSLYRSIVPRLVREQIWQVRAKPFRQYLEDLLVRWRVAVGSPVVRVNVSHASLYVDLRDNGVGRTIHANGAYEPAETQFLSLILREGMVVVDIGANIGYFTTLAAKCVGRGGKVIAVEPDPYNFRLLLRNIRNNRLNNVLPFELALGSSPHEARLFRSAENYGDHRLYGEDERQRDSVYVPVDTLDNLLAQQGIGKVDVIKMDVQGYEHLIMEGMTRTLQAVERCTILTEFWPYGIEQAGGSADEFFELLITSGFRASVLSADGSAKEADLAGVLKLIPPLNAKCPDHAYVNLIFTKDGRSAGCDCYVAVCRQS
jgi:FkbM family methyltransferase